MQTLQKPKGDRDGDESSKSSTYQPGSISIKYSDILLVEPSASFDNGLKFGGEMGEIGLWTLNSGTGSPPLDDDDVVL